MPIITAAAQWDSRARTKPRQRVHDRVTSRSGSAGQGLPLRRPFSVPGIASTLQNIGSCANLSCRSVSSPPRCAAVTARLKGVCCSISQVADHPQAEDLTDLGSRPVRERRVSACQEDDGVTGCRGLHWTTHVAGSGAGIKSIPLNQRPLRRIIIIIIGGETLEWA